MVGVGIIEGSIDSESPFGPEISCSRSGVIGVADGEAATWFVSDDSMVSYSSSSIGSDSPISGELVSTSKLDIEDDGDSDGEFETSADLLLVTNGTGKLVEGDGFSPVDLLMNGV